MLVLRIYQEWLAGGGLLMILIPSLDQVPAAVNWILSPDPVVLGSRDENGSDTDGYHRYYISFYISVRIRIRIRIVSTMLDRIWFNIDIINMWFEYSDTNTVSDVEYPDLDMDRFKPL